MSDNPTWEEVRNRAADEITPPPTPATGHWRCNIQKGWLEQVTGRGEKAPVAEAVFMSKLVEPQDDVAPTEVEGLTADDIASMRGRYRIPIFTRQDEYKVRRFVEKVLGIEPEGTLEELCAAAKGSDYVGNIVHRANPDDPEHPYWDITAPIAAG